MPAQASLRSLRKLGCKRGHDDESGCPYVYFIPPLSAPYADSQPASWHTAARVGEYSQPMRLLVVEDDPDLNRQLCAALTDAGYAVDRAFDGEEGHFLGESEHYNAVVLDVGLA